jgi:hypothetical protein
MNRHLTDIEQRIAPLKQNIIDHPSFSKIKNLEELRIFMQFHVFAVWDFMSLLKSLQNNLTCTTIPWRPVGHADTRFLINEIVTGEESDVDENGVRKSHFEIYLDAMQQCGADTTQILGFLGLLNENSGIDEALSLTRVPTEVLEFVRFTFSVINGGKSHVQAAVFTFGREDLIPGMFHSLVTDIHRHFPESISTFKYYLERHIEVDGDHHSHLALEMTEKLCGNSAEKWEEAEAAVMQALEKRKLLWDGVLNAIYTKQTA